MIRHHRITSGWLCESRVSRSHCSTSSHSPTCRDSYENDITAGHAPALNSPAGFHTTEDGILGKGDLLTLPAVVEVADPAATPLVVPPADLLPVDLVPGDGLGLGHALVIIH